MLERAFQARFFSQVEVLTDDELDLKIQEVERLSTTFVKGTEASHDGRFLLRHMRRIRMERLLNSKPKAVH